MGDMRMNPQWFKEHLHWFQSLGVLAFSLFVGLVVALIFSGCATTKVKYTSEGVAEDGTPIKETLTLGATAFASNIEKAKQKAIIDVVDNYKVTTGQQVDGLDSTKVAEQVVGVVGQAIKSVAGMSPATIAAFRGVQKPPQVAPAPPQATISAPGNTITPEQFEAFYEQYRAWGEKALEAIK